jgi:hypothetical protein
MIHDQSRLNLAPIIEYVDPVSGKLLRHHYVDIRDRVTTTSDDDMFSTSTDARQWPHLGLQYLGDARNWWVIADLSNVVDPFDALESAAEAEPVQVRIPSMSRFLFRIVTGDAT